MYKSDNKQKIMFTYFKKRVDKTTYYTKMVVNMIYTVNTALRI